ncbi:MAG: hypothetical protein GF349_04535 [Candidatus Magasanikbacteria bacterium]|nr:hypothetical protein [Candidatus Magasanikbacteria bacterium]
MKLLFQFLLALVGIIILSILNIGLSYILPYPWSKINIIFAALILLMVWWESGFIVWVAFLSFFIIELFAVTPFGLILFSSTVSILISYWFYQLIFTNQSWYTAISLSFFSIFLYRLIYIIILLMLIFFGFDINYPQSQFYYILLWEMILTCALVGIIYLLSFYFSHKKQNNTNFLVNRL